MRKRGWKTKAAAALTAAAMAVPMAMPTVGYAYDNIINEVLQISDFIDQGLYIEAIQNIDQTIAWHNLSPDDIELLYDMRYYANEYYGYYLNMMNMWRYNGTWYYTPEGDSRPLIELEISNANSNYVNAYGARMHGKGFEYLIGTAYMTGLAYCEAEGAFYWAYNGTYIPYHYSLDFYNDYIVMTMYNDSDYDEYYFYR